MPDSERMKIVVNVNGRTSILGYSWIPEDMASEEFYSRNNRVNAAIQRFTDAAVERMRQELIAALPGILAAEGLEFEALPEG